MSSYNKMQLVCHAEYSLIATAILWLYLRRSIRICADFFKDVSIRYPERVDWKSCRQLSDLGAGRFLTRTFCQLVPDFADAFGGRTAERVI